MVERQNGKSNHDRQYKKALAVHSEKTIRKNGKKHRNKERNRKQRKIERKNKKKEK